MVAVPSNSPARPAATIIAPPDVELWNWPIRDDGWLAIPPVAMFLVAVAIGYWQGSDWRLPTIAGAIAAIALHRFWIPVRYVLSVGGVSQGFFVFPRRIPWIAIRRFDVEPSGVWLFPTESERPNRFLDGIFIRFGGRRSDVMACVTYYLGAWATNAEAPTRTEFRP